MNALANLLKHGTPVESERVNPFQQAISEAEAEKAKLREENPELNKVFDVIEAAVDEAANKYNLKLELTEEQKLYQELDVACNGRLESEIPLSDDYWDVNRVVTRKLHVLKHGE